MKMIKNNNGGKAVETVKDYINTLPRKDLNTNKISLVINDERYGYNLYIFKINLKEKSCIMMNGPSKYFDAFIGLTSLSLWQLENEYGNCEIIKDNPHVGKDYREVKNLLK